MKNIWKILAIVAIIICIITISMQFIGKEKNDNKINEKVIQEVDYLDNEILSKINLLNNITFSNYKVVIKEEENNDEANQTKSAENSSNNSKSDEQSSSKEESKQSDSGEKKQMSPNSELINENESIQWSEIKKDVEIMYQSWNTIINDLYAINANNDSIEQFGTLLNQVMLEVKNENKIETIKDLSEMYAQLPIYIENIADKDKVYILNTKADVIKAYALVEEDKWDEMSIQLDNAIEQYSKINNENNGNISRGRQLLKELKESSNDKDKEIFLVKYKYCFEELIMVEGKNI